MRMMECRKTMLEQALLGLQKTEVPLVSAVDQTFIPSGYTDDLGIYYFIPWIAKTFGVPTAIDIFFGTMLLMGATIAIFCFAIIFKHPLSRLISSIGILLLTFASYKYSDVYIAPYFAVVATLPTFILLKEKKCVSKGVWFLACLISGLLLGYSNIIRSHAGTGALIFLASWIILNEGSKQKWIFGFVLLTAFCIPYAHFHVLEHHRDQFLTQSVPGYRPQQIAHPKWHSIYIGFGYLQNKYGITYIDTASYEKASSIKPDVIYCSAEYEDILKNACFELIKKDPLFVFKTFISKIFKIVLNFLIFTNFGIFALFFVRPSYRTVLPFGFAMAFYSLPGIVVIPIAAYLLGLASLATLFGIYMLCLYFERFFKFESPMKPA